MRTLLLAAATAISMAAVPAMAEPEVSQPELNQAPQAGRCLEWPVALVAARMSNPDAQLVKEMDGNMASDFVRLVNALPPVSGFDGDHVALFFRPGPEQFVAVIGHASCAKHVVELPAAVFARMVGQPV
jgi:hypothetical protein